MSIIWCELTQVAKERGLLEGIKSVLSVDGEGCQQEAIVEHIDGTLGILSFTSYKEKAVEIEWDEN